MVYGIGMKLAHLLESEQAAAILEANVPGLLNMAKASEQAGELSVEQLVRYARIPGGDALLGKLDAALCALNTPENAISPSERKLIERFAAIWRDEQAREIPLRACHQAAIFPGRPWLDTKGERIQAHGGAVYYEDGVYYWYGENKAYTDGKNGVWTWGIKVYASTDLINWDDRGYLIPPVIDDPNSSLFPAKRVDRPHIVRSRETGKYVCWIKLSGPEAAFTVWQADALLRPYVQVHAMYNPGGHKIGDFDIAQDEATGRAYIYMDADHEAMVCMELSGDCTKAVREVSRSYAGLHPPITREAPALFEAMGKKYMLTSGMTGYVPNRSDCAASDTWDGAFASIGDPHVDDASCASFNSQISKVFRVHGRDNLFIAMADRWLPRYPVDKRLAGVFTRAIASKYDPAHYAATEDEQREMQAGNVLEKANTAIADYVWLPIELSPPDDAHPNGQVRIRWQRVWRP